MIDDGAVWSAIREGKGWGVGQPFSLGLVIKNVKVISVLYCHRAWSVRVVFAVEEVETNTKEQKGGVSLFILSTAWLHICHQNFTMAVMFWAIQGRQSILSLQHILGKHFQMSLTLSGFFADKDPRTTDGEWYFGQARTHTHAHSFFSCLKQALSKTEEKQMPKSTKNL